MTSRRLMATLAALAAMAVFVTGCKGNSSSGSSGPDTSNAGSGESLMTEAKDKVAGFEAGPDTYPGPGESDAFDPGTGKAGVLVCGNAAPVCAAQGQIAVDALTAMGWDAGS